MKIRKLTGKGIKKTVPFTMVSKKGTYEQI
jgi:hypothetical protein